MTDRFLYQNASLIDEIDRLITDYRQQRIFFASAVIKQLPVKLLQIAKTLQGEDMKGILSDEFREKYYTLLECYLREIVGALEISDYVYCADCLFQLKGQVIEPLQMELMGYLEGEGNKEAEECKRLCSGRYALEYTTSVFYTLKSEGKGYLHSNLNPKAEARMWIDREFDPSKSEYVVLGAGLLYHVEALYEKCQGHLPITVCECDPAIIEVAGRFGPFYFGEASGSEGNAKPYQRELPGEIRLVWDPEGKTFADLVSRPNAGILIHEPSIKCIPNDKLRDVIRKFSVNDASVKQFKDLLNLNFAINTRLCGHYLGEALELMGKGSKTAIVLAGGPSLDKNIQELVQLCQDEGRRKDYLILSVGTIFRKLMKAGITPDYVLAQDALEQIYDQVSGLEDCGVPLILGSTVSPLFLEKYKGPLYIAFQEGYAPAERLAEEKKQPLVKSGGSVSGFALEIAVMAGCREIICAGLDLAYTNGQSHSSGNLSTKEITDEETLEVEGYEGGMVNSCILFVIYRQWIENRVKSHPEISFIDATEGGARIAGMKQMTLREALQIEK